MGVVMLENLNLGYVVRRVYFVIPLSAIGNFSVFG